MPATLAADSWCMGRSLGLPLLLVSLVIGGFLFVQQTRTQGPTAPAVTQAEAQAQAAVAGTAFQAADQELQAWYATNGTYTGATLSPGAGATVVRADASSFCLQAGSGAAVEHQLGPNGGVQPGAC
jgi:hypothetical protein